MKCTDKERMYCNVEKMGCKGCAYYEEEKDNNCSFNKPKKTLEIFKKSNNKYHLFECKYYLKK